MTTVKCSEEGRREDAAGRQGGAVQRRSRVEAGVMQRSSAALGVRGHGKGAASVLWRRRRQGSDVLGQHGEANPGGSEWAPMVGWRLRPNGGRRRHGH